jgi:hypothetical protein
MDWKGLLNWTMKYHDGTTDTANIKPMSEEDMKFLESAMESVCVNEMKEIMKILDKLKETEKEDEVDDRCAMLEELLILIEGLENSRNLVRAKRFEEIIQYFFTTKNKKIKMMLADILTSMMQNEMQVQEAAIPFGIFKILELLNSSDDKELTSKYIYLLTGLLYGHYEKPKRMFIEDFEGIKLLYNLTIKSYSGDSELDKKNFKRILSIIKELTRIEDKESDNYLTRHIAITKIKEIEMQHMLLDFLRNLEFTEESSEESINRMKIILQIFVNICKVYENLDDLFKEISNLNKKITESTALNEETKKEEGSNLIECIKTIKTEFSSKIELENNTTLSLSSIENNGKQTMHLQLK